jgi:cupin fold WbuC family metalloprotein
VVIGQSNRMLGESRWTFEVQPGVGTTLTAEDLSVATASSSITRIDSSTVDVVVKRAIGSSRKRSRVLLHSDRSDSLHEMLIVLPEVSCDVPHINMKSAKSFHVIRGRMVLMVFSDDGRSVQPYRLAEMSEGVAFMVRLDRPCWHTIIPCTPFVAFIETIIGPFTGNQFAPWAPDDMNGETGQEFATSLRAIARKCDEGLLLP